MHNGGITPSFGNHLGGEGLRAVKKQLLPTGFRLQVAKSRIVFGRNYAYLYIFERSQVELW